MREFLAWFEDGGHLALVVLAVFSPSLAFISLIFVPAAIRRFRSRGEVAEVPEERIDEMGIDDAVEADDFAMWKTECVKLQRLADKLGQVKR